jgi:hypothetical protein
LDIVGQIKKAIANDTKKQLWAKDGKNVDVSKLAIELFRNMDVEIFCSCPAFSFWGPAYTLTQAGAKYTKPENRPPNIRNPRQDGCQCKHSSLLWKVLPMYTSTMAKWLNMYYLGFIGGAEQKVLKQEKAVSGKEEDTGKKESIVRENAEADLYAAAKKYKTINVYIDSFNIPKFQSSAFRVDSGFKAPGSAFDVIEYAKNEEGNVEEYSHLSLSLLRALKTVPAKDIIWVTKTKNDAKRYADMGEIEQVTHLGKNARIIAEDGDGGFLVLTTDGVNKLIDIWNKAHGVTDSENESIQHNVQTIGAFLNV